MKKTEEEDIFYYNFGDDIRMSHFSNLDVYNTEFKSQIFFSKNQLEIFIKDKSYKK